MDLKLQGRNIQIDESLRAYATQKLNRLDRLLPENSLAEMEVNSSPTRAQSDRITIQATIKSGGVILRAEQRASNANAAIDSVVDILERKIAKFKTQTYRSKRTSTPFRVLQAEEAEQAVDPREGAILSDGTLLRLKEFPMEPMTVEEAALQMEMVGHSFYMFLNDESGKHNVLYRREDGNYGLIQPIDAE
jgi:putative sigma-54 modulation protein